MSNPLVSVIMPVCNGETYIQKATESILNQTLSQFELIIIDDGSTDKSIDILKDINDNRIKIIHTNGVGISQALNIGIENAKATYIARMDCDDICESNRLEEQLKFMKKDTERCIIGCNANIIDENGAYINSRTSNQKDTEIKIALFLGETSVLHPTMMINADFIKKNKIQYDTRYNLAEDYDLLCRASFYTRFENMDEVLLNYRVHNHSTSKTNYKSQRIVARNVLKKHLGKMNVLFTEEELTCHYQYALSLGENIKIEKLMMWNEKLMNMNLKKHWFNPQIFNIELYKRIERWKRNNEL